MLRPGQGTNTLTSDARLHYLNGDRVVALRQYEQCVIALEKELSVWQSKGTVALYEQILADQLDEPKPDFASAEILLEISEFLLSNILTRLIQL